MFAGALCYADDLVLLAPYASGGVSNPVSHARSSAIIPGCFPLF